MNYRIKTVKYLLAVVLIFLGCVTVSELNIIDMLNNLESKPSICFEIPDNTEDFINKINDISEKNNILVYTSDIDYKDYNSLKRIIYCTSDKTEAVRKDLGIKNDEFRSIFYNTVSIDFREMSDNNRMGSAACFYMIGQENGITSFYESVKEISPVSSCNLCSQQHIDTIKIINFAIWMIITMMMLMITLYDVNVNKKEAYIRMINGESGAAIVTRYIACDIIFYISVITVILQSVKYISCISLSFRFLMFTFIFFCSVNIIPYFSLLRFKVDILKKDKFPRKSLIYNYIFVFVTAFISICAIISSLNITGILGDYLKLRGYVDMYDKYSVCDFQIYKSNGMSSDNMFQMRKTDEVLNEKIYREYFNKLRPVVFVKCCDNEIYANLNAYDYISSNIKEFADAQITSDICIIMPDFYTQEQKDQKIRNSLQYISETEGKNFNFNYQIVEYHANVRLVTISDLDTKGTDFFEINKNSVVIYNSVVPDTLPTEVSEPSRAEYMDDILYMMTPELLDEIKEEFSLEKEICAVTGISEYYNYNLMYIKNTTSIIYFSTVVVLIIELFVNTAAVTINYKINAKELALKKVYGYSLIEKNKKTSVLSMTAVMLSVLINFIIFTSYQVIWIGALLILFMSAVIIVQMTVSEKNNLSVIIRRK